MLDELKAEIQRQVIADVILTIKEMNETGSNNLNLFSGDSDQAIMNAKAEYPDFNARAYACAVADTYLKFDSPDPEYAIGIKFNMPFVYKLKSETTIYKLKAGIPNEKNL